MNEVEKMYENAGIEPTQEGYCDCGTFCPYPHHKCNDECPYWKYEDIAKYPPFTAEKQIELIKWLAKRQDFGLNYYPNSEVWDAQTQFSWEFYCKTYEHKNFDEALAGLINTLWQDLTEEERKQIKEILE